MLHFVYKDRRKVRRHNEWLHTRVSRGRKRAYLSGETVVVSTPHRCKSVVRRERGAERCLSLRSADRSQNGGDRRGRCGFGLRPDLRVPHGSMPVGRLDLLLLAAIHA